MAAVNEIRQLSDLVEPRSKEFPIIEMSPSPVEPFQVPTNLVLTQLIRWKSARLLTMLGRNKSEHYSILYLKKKGKTGKFRTLHNPDNLMRVVQYKILKEILEKVPVPEYIHAFEKGRSIPEMAAQHVRKKVVISLDLKDFFTSIKQYHLEQLFVHLGFGSAPARTLSELCTYKTFVPQGALTSPKVSNIITALTFGPVLKKHCDEKGYTLSIYADDITISSDHKFDGQEGRETAIELIRRVREVVKGFGFRVNEEKIKVMSTNHRQWVCGTVVNQKVNLLKHERYKLRAIVHNCEINGMEAEAAKNNYTVSEFISKIMGKLNWWSQLNPEVGERIKNKFRELCAEHCEPTTVTEDVKDETSVSSGSPLQLTVSTTTDTPW